MTFICNACRLFFGLNGRLRTPEEVELFLTKAALARREGTALQFLVTAVERWKGPGM